MFIDAIRKQTHMPTVKINRGDCIDKIAEEQDLLPDTIWNHPDNKALKTSRKNKNVLYPGDKLFVPEKVIKSESVSGGAKHKFKRKAVPIEFTLQMKKNDAPRANLAYSLTIENKTFQGKTDGDGWIKHSIPTDAQKGRLEIDDGKETYELNLGHLDPVDEIEGVQQRLKSLGYYAGEVDGVHGDKTRTAIQFYQKEKDIAVSGSIDEGLKDSLTNGYGS